MITVKVNGGLGNRMRVLASCKALISALPEQKMKVIWERNDELNVPFGHLFEPIPGVKLVERRYLPRLFFLLRRKRRIKDNSHYLRASLRLSDAEIRSMADREQALLSLIEREDSVYINTCEHFFGLQSAVKDLAIRQHIWYEVEKIKDKLSKSYVGMHIRRGDNHESISRSPLYLFETKIEALTKGGLEQSIFVASDDQGVKKQLGERFKSLHFAPNKYRRNQVAGAEEALISLLVLAGSEKIYGSYWSSFSEVSALVGGIELEVLVRP